jgi:hypothetical protein
MLKPRQEQDVAMPDPPPDDQFVWHPRWSGQRAATVREQILDEVRGDQRAYALALEAAERHENDALASTVALDRKWGGFALDWTEADPDAMSDAVLAAEWERERRREMVPLAALRETVGRPTLTPGSDDLPEKAIRLTDPAARRWVLLAVLILVILLVVWLR